MNRFTDLKNRRVHKSENRNVSRTEENNPWLNRGIVYNNGVPFVTYGFWFGEMKGNRLHNFQQLKNNIGTPFVLITKENIFDFEVTKYPFHPSVKYTLKNKQGLSGVHLSDYFRNYIAYHFGGGYHDIKLRLKTQSIASCWEFFNSSNVWVVGMPSVGGFAGDTYTKDYIMMHENTTELVGSEDGKWDCRNSEEKNVLGNGAWVSRPKNDIFKKVNALAEIRLSSWFETIKSHPVINFKRCCEHGEVKGYPVPWAALHGRILHPYEALYRSHIIRKMPRYQFAAYRDKSENL